MIRPSSCIPRGLRPPKGAVIAHRCLLGNLSGFEMSHNFFPQADDLMWTPADWAWTGGLLDALIPAWFYGKPVLGYDGGRFDAEKARMSCAVKLSRRSSCWHRITPRRTLCDRIYRMRFGAISPPTSIHARLSLSVNYR